MTEENISIKIINKLIQLPEDFGYKLSDFFNGTLKCKNLDSGAFVIDSKAYDEDNEYSMRYVYVIENSDDKKLHIHYCSYDTLNGNHHIIE